MADQKKPHLYIDKFAQAVPYRRPKIKFPKAGDFGRTFQQHSEQLKRDAAEAWAQADSLLNGRQDPTGTPGGYLSFETARDAQLPNLEWKSEGVRLAAAKRDAEGKTSGAIFVPDTARDFLADKLTKYGSEVTRGGSAVNQARFAPLEKFSAARLETLWVDNRPVPVEGPEAWWECWCWPDKVQNLKTKAIALNLAVSPDEIKFPERVIVFVYARRSQIARLVSSTDAVAELRLGKDTASAFVGDPKSDPDGWVASCSEKIADERTATSPAVCMLDTGVNRAHPLLAPFLHPNDMHTLKEPWGTDDHDGHGTELAGLAVYGDLLGPVQSTDAVPVSINIESVKVLPPSPFPANEPSHYGLLTLQAVARPEVNRPDRKRVYCLAVGQSDVSGPRASSWSAAIDKAAYDSDPGDAERRPRLIVIAAGNIPDGLKLSDLENWDDFEIEDPGQAWNALTVGGVTQKAEISEAGHGAWSCAAGVDNLSPYSRVSASWRRGVAPIKPELLCEAGNRGVDPADSSMWSGMPSLSLLTTGSDIEHNPLAITWATSAAAAQVAGMAAKLHGDNPDYWPETVRALLVHGSQWTGPMKAIFGATPQKASRLSIVRRLGYGWPSLERARNSASAHLAMISQSRLQPFKKAGSAAAKMHNLHFYELPWPSAAFAKMTGSNCRLRVTLSYFIDPNPSAEAPLAPARYRSYGLRFELQKQGESVAAFKKRLNDLSSDPDELFEGAMDDGNRLLGVRATSAGSLHSDEWNCPAPALIGRNYLAVYPVGGWWKSSKDPAIANQECRYSLVVTLDGGDTTQDLYTEVAAAIEAKIVAPVVVDVDA